MPDESPSPSSEGPKETQREIADAELLFQDDAVAKAPPEPMVGQSGRIDSNEVFDIGEEPVRPSPTTVEGTRRETPQPRPRPQVTASPVTPSPTHVSDPAEERVKEARRQAFPTGDEVDQIWTRGQEWGSQLALLAAWAICGSVLLYGLLSFELFTLALLMFLGGGLVTLYLLYPILITLERPVRLTPETAVKDYFAAISHHMPHYRRMWLLLTRQARLTPYFGSFEGFEKYWKQRLAEMKSKAKASSTTPLLFQVDNFVSERNAEKTQAQTRFTLRVFVRGRRDEGPILELPMRMELLIGPDKMWYLCKGIVQE